MQTKAQTRQIPPPRNARFSTDIYPIRKKACGSGLITTKPSSFADMTTNPGPHSVHTHPGHHLSVEPRQTETPNGAEGGVQRRAFGSNMLSHRNRRHLPIFVGLSLELIRLVALKASSGICGDL